MGTSQIRFATRRNLLAKEQRATEKERRHDRYTYRQPSMTAEERLIQNEYRRKEYRARQNSVEKINLPSSSASNIKTNLFEHVIRKNVQEEVERIIGRNSTMSMNIALRFMKLGSECRVMFQHIYIKLVLEAI
ncbi:hypothetical protein MKX01_040383 [Papaver californicum]|nr:hypothetical protein MKX01_040383 [Papaver californicum]